MKDRQMGARVCMIFLLSHCCGCARVSICTRYWSHDIGGFHNGTWMKGFGPFKNRKTGWMDEPGSEDPLNAEANELYLRWLQFATFAPIFRTHCQLEPIPIQNICSPEDNPHCQVPPPPTRRRQPRVDTACGC